MDRQALIDEAWNFIGFKLRTLQDRLVVRTDPPPEKFEGSSLYLPPSKSTFYGEMPKEVTTFATVMAVGPDASQVKIGDRVAFTRIFFARWEDMPDGSKVGWVSEKDLSWVCEEDE